MAQEATNIREDLVPGAKYDRVYLNDLTTAGTQLTGHTNIVDWFGLHAGETRNPTGVRAFR